MIWDITRHCLGALHNTSKYYWKQKQVSDGDIVEYQSGEKLLYAGVDFDIYFLDIEMDSVSGMKLARHIREREENSRNRDGEIYVHYV